MSLDSSTMLTVSVFTHLLLGGLLLFSWRNSRNSHVLLFLGIFFIGAALFDLLRSHAISSGEFLFRDIGLAMLFLGYGAAWQAARRFERQPTSILAASAGGLGWLVFSLLASGSVLSSGRTVATAAVPVIYSSLAIFELFRGRHEYLPSRLPLCAALGIKCAVSATRTLVLIVEAAQTGTAIAVYLPEDWSALLRLFSIGANIAVAYLILSLIKERLEAEQVVQILVDPLTGLGNRRALRLHAERVLRRQEMAGQPVCVAIIDLDHFKQINDTFGHPAGDTVLRVFAERAALKLRPNDYLFRIGGEEFLCILQSAQEPDAMAAVERIRRTMQDYGLGEGETARSVTMSAGIASTRCVGYDLDDLMSAADNALYAAKRAGRDRVHIHRYEDTPQEQDSA